MCSALQIPSRDLRPPLRRAAAVGVLALWLAPAVVAAGVKPLVVADTLPPGGVRVVDKTVETSPIPPRPDIVFLSDTTGSMGGAIGNVKANAAAILNAILLAQPGAQFGVAEYKDEGDAYVYKLNQAVTGIAADAVNGINAWSAGGGGDTPEGQLYALHRIATDASVGFRTTASSRVIVWFGDAPGHDPSAGISLPQAIADLQGAGIQVLAIDVGNLNQTGQAVAIANATGGAYLANPNPNTVAQAILDGLSNLPVRITPMVGTCDAGLIVEVQPAEAVIQSGGSASFQETIRITPDAPQCTTLRCTVEWWLNGLPVLLDDGTRDPNWVQQVVIAVPDVTPPTIQCPDVIRVCNDAGKCSAVVDYQVIPKDNCGVASVVCDPPSGSEFPVGTTIVHCVVTDTSGLTAECSFAVEVTDCEAPQVTCTPTTNPAGKNVPKAGDNPKSGQNPDGFYQLGATDNCDAPGALVFQVCDSADASVCFGPFANGDQIKVTQAPGAPQSSKPMAGVIVAHLTLKGDPVVKATDASGNTGTASCFVPPPPK